MMSRVQATRDHHGKDCRFLSFRRGDTILVYHKLTGKREDLWAGSIDRKFGYFPKEAVEEEQVYATMEKIVETQKSDFYCMDEFGYPIDSGHLDTDGDDDDSDQEIPIQESEATQTSPYTDDTNAGSPLTSEDATTESPVQESEVASAEENENKNKGDDAAGTHTEVDETPAALNEQGGSSSSSWLSSSVTGWLGLANEGEPGDVAEGEKKDEIEETQAKDSFTSSMTGWLGLGGEGKPDDAKDSVNSQEEDGETADSFTSTMTGWLGFGGEKKTEQEHDEETKMDEEKEPAEKFRGRRLSLDLEADQLQGEEKKEMGTLGWLGNGLSSTLGFGLTNQESGDETTADIREAEETSQEEEEQPASTSWFDLGVTDILGFRKDKNEVDETSRSGSKETEEDKTLEQPPGSQTVDTSQSQPALIDEAKTEPSFEKLEEKVVTKTESVLEAEGDNMISSSNKDKTETQQDQKDLPSDTETQSSNTASVNADSNDKLEEKSHAVSSSKEEEEGRILDDNKNEKNVVDQEKKTEMESEDHQMPESVGNEDEFNGREPGEEIQTASDIDQDSVSQNDIASSSVSSSDDLGSNSMGQSDSEAEEVKKDPLQGEKTESVDEEEAEITKQSDNTEESTETSVEIGASGDDHKGEGSNEQTDVHHQEVPTTLRDESAEQSQVNGGAGDSSGGSLPSLSSDTAEEKNEPVPSEDDSLTVGHSDTLAKTDNNTETETHHGLHSSPHNQNDIGNEKETQEESESVFSEAAEKTEKSQTESFQAEEERREGELQEEEKQEAVEVKEDEKREVEVKQQAKDVEDKTKSKEEEESLKCSNELCSQSVQDEKHDSENGSSSVYEGTIQTGQDDSGHMLSARTEESERISFESDKDRIQEEGKMKNEMEEKRNDDTKADVREKEQEETKNIEQNEHIGRNSANGISDQKGENEHVDNEVPYSGENDHRLPNESSDHLYSGETKNADLCNDADMKCAGETSDTGKITEQIHSDDHNRGTAEAESGGAFGLFKNAFNLFGETPTTEIKESTEPAPSLDTSTGETSQPEASLTPEQEPDSATPASQVNIEDLHSDSPAIAEIQPSSPSQMQTPSHPSVLSPNTEAPLKPKTASKHYKTLLTHMSADDTTILEELFGQHKLQFLDYILGHSEPATEDLDDDESILLDIETLLHHRRDTLFAPSMKLTDAPQEDKEKTGTLIALQKLEMLLKTVRETFNTRKSDIIRANRQGEASCVGASCSAHSKDQEVIAGDESRKTGVMKQILDFVHQIAEDSFTHVCAVRKILIWLTVQLASRAVDFQATAEAYYSIAVEKVKDVVSSLPDDIRPGPDLYGVPWEPVIISSLVGLVTMLLFSCRCYSSVKSRMYRSRERWMAEQVAQLLDEKCKVLETLSTCQQEYDELETSLRDSGVLAQTQKTEHLEGKTRQLEHAKRELERDLDQLKDQLDQQREHRLEQERRIAALEESMKTCEEETKDLQSQEEQAQTTLKVYSMNSDRLQRNLETAGEENTLQQESNAQLRQQVEGWAERVSELEEEMRRCEVAYSGMVQDVANKDERIMSLTDRLLRMKAWDSDLEEERGEEGGEETSNGTAGKGEENGRGDESQGHLQKVQKLIYAAKLNADLKSVDEDKDRTFAKLNDEVKAKEELEVSIKELENEKLSLQSDSENYSDQVQRLQQKLNIMTEMYQENELKLHRLLTVEEKERLQKEEKLNKADKNIALAMEELQNYRHRAEEMEEELEKTKQSYQTQISAHEKKAHNNWLAARAADRELSDTRRENALLRQKLTDTQFKMDALDKDPYALESLARPLPFRAERSPYGPSPLGRPASETRAFLSPPTLMEGPPARLSPRVEPPGGYGDMERSGGPHSDSGSISPTWERERRGPPPGPLGPLGPPGVCKCKTKKSGPSDRRTPPEADPRMGGAPPPGPPMGPMDGPFPRRAPYGPPPPDFYPPRGPGGPPMMPMWAPPPPGMMFPPRFPPGGPPHPHMPSYGPPMRPPPPDDLPPPSMGPRPHSQSPEEHTPSPQDVI
eukprot:superscaffoldBa00000409_g4512